MKALAFESTGGASGDMILSVFAALGVDMAAIQQALQALAVDPFELVVEELREGGFVGHRVAVHVHEHGHAHHRHLDDIRQIIQQAGLPPRAAELSTKTFERLARAEAAVHGTTLADIHFHEVGAMDSIIDIVGSCLALDSLGIDAVSVGPLPLGCGETTFSHGTVSVPVPATLELLKGHPVRQTDEPFELVTPTGAALLTTWRDELPAQDLADVAAVIERVGVGFGTRKLKRRLNALRGRLMRTAMDTEAPDQCLVLECNMDDSVPELLGSLTETLLARGALDVFTTAVQMKKQRPGTLLTVLCSPAKRAGMLDTIFRESTTFGIREHLTERTVLQRRHEEVQTPYGTVRIKIGTWQGKVITRAPEHADCVACAARHDVPVRTVYEAALRAG